MSDPKAKATFELCEDCETRGICQMQSTCYGLIMRFKTPVEIGKDIERMMSDLVDALAEHPSVPIDARAWWQLYVYFPKRSPRPAFFYDRKYMLCIGGPCHGHISSRDEWRWYEVIVLPGIVTVAMGERMCMIGERHFYSVDHEQGVLRYMHTEPAR